jgi:DNA (cytosine-5)-methyltransferase 1
VSRELTVGSLFSGVGAFELGLLRAGFGRVLWQVEREEFCRRVLAKHFPDAERFDDVRTVGAAELADVFAIVGGFPCQDIAPSGSRLGLDGERSGLWSEFFRIVREMGPRVVVVENSSNLTLRGLGCVLGDLASVGFDSVWDCIPAAAVGAPFRRDRCFIVASREPWIEAVADPDRWRREVERVAQSRGFGGEHRGLPHGRPPHRGVLRAAGSGWWSREPALARVVNGSSSGLDRRRLTAHGNAIAPQVSEVLGRVILGAMAA